MSYNTVIVQIRPDGRFEAWEPHGCGNGQSAGLGTFKSMEDGVQDVTARYHYLGLKPLYQSNQVCVFEYGDDPAIQAKLAEALEAARKANLRVDAVIDSLCRCKADWARLKDWCIAGNGPGEMFRLQDSAKTATNHAEVFINYINSLWKEITNRKAQAKALSDACQAVVAWRESAEGPDTLFEKGAAMLKQVKEALETLKD